MAEQGWERRFEEHAAAVVESGMIPAVAVALAHEGTPIYERGFGHRDAARSLPVTPDTRFGLGSVTKSFPALALVQLDEAGALSIDDPVTRWLPEFRLPRPEDRANASRITIHHFLTHSAGLPPEPSLLHARAASILADPDFERMQPKPLAVPPDVHDLEPIETYEELMALMAHQDFRALARPGRVISYSNEGYVLLAAIVERAAGRSFAAYLQEHILDPLGMARTSLYTRSTPPLEPEVVPSAAGVRDGQREVFASPAWWDQGRMFGNGGLKSTTRDLLRYLEVYRSGGTGHGRRVVSPAGVARMTSPQIPIPTGGAYGYGLVVDDVPEIGRVVEHSGGNKGVATHVVVVPERGLTAVVLTNLANAPAAALAYGLVNAFLGRAPATPWREYPTHAIDEPRLRRFVGTYQGQPGSVLDVALHDGTLVATAGGDAQPARPYGPSAFRVEARNETIAFLEDERGQVWAAQVGLRCLPRDGA